MNKPSIIIRVVTQKMFPFLLMFGFYIILHGSSSPGGGFQGGVVIGAAYILYAIGVDADHGRRLAPYLHLKIIESAGVLIYVGLGFAGICLGYSFLTNRMIGFPPQGTPGSLLSGGTILGINIGIGIHVAATVITLFYAFMEYEKPKESKEADLI